MAETQEKTKRPAFQFYPADWRKDVELQSCSMTAQGLWINVMCIAHECEPYGHLMVNGKPMTLAQLGRQVGLSLKECEALIAELMDAGVIRRTEQGAYFSKRMVQDEVTRNARAAGGKSGAEHGAKGASHGKKGGRPAQPKGGFETPLDDEPKPPPSSSSSSSSSDLDKEPYGSVGSADDPGDKKNPKEDEKTELPACPVQKVVDLYHEVLPELPKVRLLNDGRRRSIQKLWKWVLTSKKTDKTARATNAEEALAWIQQYFTIARGNDFLMGRTPRTGEHVNWQCDLDFLLTDRGMKHVIEKTQKVAA